MKMLIPQSEVVATPLFDAGLLRAQAVAASMVAEVVVVAHLVEMGLFVAQVVAQVLLVGPRLVAQIALTQMASACLLSVLVA